MKFSWTLYIDIWIGYWTGCLDWIWNLSVRSFGSVSFPSPSLSPLVSELTPAQTFVCQTIRHLVKSRFGLDLSSCVFAVSPEQGREEERQDAPCSTKVSPLDSISHNPIFHHYSLIVLSSEGTSPPQTHLCLTPDLNHLSPTHTHHNKYFNLPAVSLVIIESIPQTSHQ